MKSNNNQTTAATEDAGRVAEIIFDAFKACYGEAGARGHLDAISKAANDITAAAVRSGESAQDLGNETPEATSSEARTETGLAPCPFCGSIDLRIYHGHGGNKVKCFGCHTTGVLIEVWNRRVTCVTSEGEGSRVSDPKAGVARSGWIDYEKRQPQIQDGDGSGKVLWHDPRYGTQIGFWNSPMGYRYWMRIPPFAKEVAERSHSPRSGEKEKDFEAELVSALEFARRTIKALHGEIAWPEYQHSPEMKAINGALAKACYRKANATAAAAQADTQELKELLRMTEQYLPSRDEAPGFRARIDAALRASQEPEKGI